MFQLTVMLRPDDETTSMEEAFKSIGRAYDGDYTLQRSHQTIKFAHEHPGAVVLARLFWLNDEAAGGQAQIARLNGQHTAAARQDLQQG